MATEGDILIRNLLDISSITHARDVEIMNWHGWLREMGMSPSVRVRIMELERNPFFDVMSDVGFASGGNTP